MIHHDDSTYLSSAGVGPPPKVGKSSSLCKLGATLLRRGTGFTGESAELELALMPALSEGGMYLPVVRAGVVSDLLSSTGGGAATTQDV